MTAFPKSVAWLQDHGYDYMNISTDDITVDGYWEILRNKSGKRYIENGQTAKIWHPWKAQEHGEQFLEITVQEIEFSHRVDEGAARLLNEEKNA